MLTLVFLSACVDSCVWACVSQCLCIVRMILVLALAFPSVCTDSCACTCVSQCLYGLLCLRFSVCLLFLCCRHLLPFIKFQTQCQISSKKANVCSLKKKNHKVRFQPERRRFCKSFCKSVVRNPKVSKTF